MQVLNKLHGQRFKLEESLKKLQECMNLLEKEHAWQDHVDELSLPMQQHQAVVQVFACSGIPLMIFAGRYHAARLQIACLTGHQLVVHVCLLL